MFDSVQQWGAQFFSDHSKSRAENIVLGTDRKIKWHSEQDTRLILPMLGKERHYVNIDIPCDTRHRALAKRVLELLGLPSSIEDDANPEPPEPECGHCADVIDDGSYTKYLFGADPRVEEANPPVWCQARYSREGHAYSLTLIVQTDYLIDRQQLIRSSRETSAPPPR